MTVGDRERDRALALPHEPERARARAAPRMAPERLPLDAPVLLAVAVAEAREPFAQVAARVAGAAVDAVADPRARHHRGERRDQHHGRGDHHRRADRRHAQGEQTAVEQQPERAQRDGRDDAARHHRQQPVGFRARRGGAEVDLRQPLCPVGLPGRERGRRQRGDQGADQAAGGAEQDQQPDADDGGEDRAAREREVERHHEHRDRRRAGQAHPGRLAQARRHPEVQDEPDRAQHPERVPVGERELQPLDLDAGVRRQLLGQEAGQQRDQAERRDREPEPAQEQPEVARLARHEPEQHEHEQVEQRAVELDDRPPAASDQPAESRIQTAKPARPAAPASSGALTPANGRGATVRKTASATASAAAVRPVTPGKNPPARNDRKSVSAAAPARCSRHPATRTRHGRPAAGSSGGAGSAAGMAGKHDGPEPGTKMAAPSAACRSARAS